MAPVSPQDPFEAFKAVLERFAPVEEGGGGGGEDGEVRWADARAACACACVWEAHATEHAQRRRSRAAVAGAVERLSRATAERVIDMSRLGNHPAGRGARRRRRAAAQGDDV